MSPDIALISLLAPFALFAVGAVRLRSHAAYEWAAWLGVVAAAGAGALAAIGPVTSTTFGWGGLGLSVRLDALSAIIFAMVSLLAVPLLRFSTTYLEGDPRRPEFLRKMAWTIASVEVLVLAGNVLLLVLAWVASSILVGSLIRWAPDRVEAENVAKKKAVVARLSEAMLIAAAAFAYVAVGTGDIATIVAAANGGSFDATVPALLLAGAALVQSGQLPFHGWLSQVMEAPTPVSALLHAGILNAGPYLLCRFYGVLDASDAAGVLVICVASVTAIVASVVRMTQPAVKTSLGYSSAAHMGFR